MRAWQEDLDNLFAFEGPPPAGEAEVGVAKPSPPRPRRRRRRRKQSRRALAARRANLRKARAAPREIIYRPTEKRQAASRANLKKAQAARRTPRGNARTRLNALKHGLYAVASLRESLGRLGESRRELTAHRRRFARLFAPLNEDEERLVRQLADVCWRRLRFFRAAASWEANRLQQILRRAPRRVPLDVEQTAVRASALVLALTYTAEVMDRESAKFNSQIEADLRARSGGALDFRFFSPRRDLGSRPAGRDPFRDPSLAFEVSLEELAQHFQALSPQARARILPVARKPSSGREVAQFDVEAASRRPSTDGRSKLAATRARPAHHRRRATSP
jgi:hypothetical protein